MYNFLIAVSMRYLFTLHDYQWAIIGLGDKNKIKYQSIFDQIPQYP